MHYLTGLPNEILESILSRLNRTDLARTSRVSRHLNAVAEPLLYTVVELTYNGTAPSMFRMFLHTILVHPDLARYVQVLAVRWSAEEVCEVGMSGSDMVLFASVAKLRRHQFILHVPISQILLLLFHLPKIICFDIVAPTDAGMGIDEFIYDFAILPPSEHPVSFASLLELRLKCTDPEGSTSAKTMLATFEFPALRWLRIYHVVEIDEIETHRYRHLTGKSQITHFSLGCDKFNDRSLRWVMEFPRALTHFAFRFGAVEPHPFDAAVFGDALVPVQRTLEQLTVELCNTEQFMRGNEIQCAIGSLREWPVLKQVRCPLTLLLGQGPEVRLGRLAVVLPKVIQEFVVVVDEFWSAEQIVREVVWLLDDKGVCGLDWLREIAVVGEGANAVQQELRVICEMRGAVLVEREAWYW